MSEKFTQVFVVGSRAELTKAVIQRLALSGFEHKLIDDDRIYKFKNYRALNAKPTQHDLRNLNLNAWRGGSRKKGGKIGFRRN